VSDTSQGPGWWQASDGKWYPPEQAPGYQAPSPGAPFGADAPYGGAPSGGGGGAIDVGVAFNWAWAKYQAHLQPLLILGLVVGGIPFLLNLIRLFTNSTLVFYGLTFTTSLVGLILTMLSVQAGLEIASTGTLNQASMFQFRANIVTYVVAAILFVILEIVGVIACCIGFFFVWLIFGLWQFVAVDRDASPIDALTGSKDLVLGPGFGTTFVPVLVFLVLSLLSSLAGGLSCGVGAIIGILTIPLASLYGAYIYKSLSGQPVAP
jgi:hypothetical protein